MGGACYSVWVSLDALVMSESQELSCAAYYGTSGSGEGHGIYLQRFQAAPLRREAAGLEWRDDKAGFLRFNASEDRLYAIALAAEGRGLVKAFCRDKATGALSFINEAASGGGGLCHLNLDRSERWLLGTSYGDARVTLFPLEKGGAIGPPRIAFGLEGDGSRVNALRQDAPHAHSIYADSTNRYLFVCDLGMDRIYLYAFDAESGKLEPAAIPYIETAPGSGPRHMAFHPNGRWVYAINELNGTIVSYDWSAETAVLNPIHTVDTLPEGFSGENTTAEIVVHPSGRFVYGSNRGDDSLVAYAVDPATGGLGLLQRVPSGGAHPRHFALNAAGTLLAVANRDSDNIVYFSIEEETGLLEERGRVEGIPACTCVRILP